MILINGQPMQAIPVQDRGLQYGDGLFETIEIAKGRPLFWPLHWRRLQRGCIALSLPPPDERQLYAESLALSRNQTRAVLKIIYTRGSGGRGYRAPQACRPTRILNLHPFPDYPPAYWQTGVALHVCTTHLSHQPRLAGLKHLNRLEQVLARAEWEDDTIPEGVMCDEHGHVIEGTMSNLFFVRAGEILTPELDRCGVAGIMREVIIGVCAAQGTSVRSGRFTLDELFAADEVFVTNSLIGLWPVTRIASRNWPIGVLTRRIATWLEAVRQQELRHAE